MYDKEKIVSFGKQAFVKRPTFLKRAFSYTNFLIATILGFAVLTFFVRQYDYFNFDLTITIFIQKYSQNWFDLLMRLITLMGNGPAVGIIVIALSLYGYLIGKRHSPLLLVISTFGGIIISQLLKILVARPRPDPSLINRILLKYNSPDVCFKNLSGSPLVLGCFRGLPDRICLVISNYFCLSQI